MENRTGITRTGNKCLFCGWCANDNPPATGLSDGICIHCRSRIPENDIREWKNRIKGDISLNDGAGSDSPGTP